MPRGQPQPSESPFASARNSLNFGLSVSRIWATSLEVFLHSGLGHRYLGVQALAVLLLIPIYTMFWQGYDIRPLVWFLMAYLAMCFVNRIGNLARSGERQHSYYTGWPRLIGRTSKLSELVVKRFIEPALALAIGFILRVNVNAPLGTYLMIGAGCLFVSVSASEMEDQTNLDDLHDRVIEQETIAERFRDMRGGD